MTTDTPASGAHRLMVALSYFLTAVGLLLAFLPWGWGFITLGTGILSFLLARAASNKSASRTATLAWKLSVLPVIVYATYMIVVIPTRTTPHTAQARVVSTGELADSSTLTLDHALDEPVQGVVVDVEPCTARFIVRTTPERDAQLDEDIPSPDTRSCLESLQADTEVEVEVEITRRWLSSEVKSYSVSRIGGCALSGHNALAVLSSGFCEAWSP